MVCDSNIIKATEKLQEILKKEEWYVREKETRKGGLEMYGQNQE